MRGFWMAMRGAAACLVAVALVGCENRLPTAGGADLFPNGTTPTTVEVFVPSGDFVLSDTVYDDFGSVADAGYLLVANRFDGALDAHTLARLTGFPDSVTYTSGGTTRTEKDFQYTAGRIVTRVDSTASQPRAPVTLQLWSLDQAWDSTAVSWQNASNREGSRVAWRVPGGTRGRLLAEGRWVPGDTVSKDTVVFRLDSLTVRMLASRDFPGVMVTSATGNSRLQISRLALETRVRPAGKPDTAIVQRISAGPHAFVFNPAAPPASRALRVGGPSAARSVLRLNLNQRVPACAPGTQPACATVPLREVTLNRATLLLEPLAVPSGFRPIATRELRLRRVLEPELGRRAPLGEALAQDTVPSSLFRAPGARTVNLDLTRLVSDRADSTSVTVTLIAEETALEFGTLWFARAPRLRLIYTLPLRPKLP